MTPQQVATLLRKAFSIQAPLEMPKRLHQEFLRVRQHGGFSPITVAFHPDVEWCVIAQGELGPEVFVCESNFGYERMLERDELTSEEKFKTAVVDVLATGHHPSGVRIHLELGGCPDSTRGGLGSNPTRWRREVLVGLGWTRGPNMRDRWKPPGGASCP